MLKSKTTAVDTPPRVCARQRGSRNRQRGQEGEREVATMLRDAYGLDVRRKLGQERDRGYDIDLAPFAIECKRRKAVANLYGWLGQAAGGIPVVCVRGDGAEWLVCMRLADWIPLAREEIAAASTTPHQVLDSQRSAKYPAPDLIAAGGKQQ